MKESKVIVTFSAICCTLTIFSYTVIIPQLYFDIHQLDDEVKAQQLPRLFN